MNKAIITGLSVLGIVGTSSVAFATNMQALDMQASQDVSGGSSQLVATSAADLDLHTEATPDPSVTPPAAATPAPTDPAVSNPEPSDSDAAEATEPTESTEKHTDRNLNAATPATPATPAHASTSGSTVPATPATPSTQSHSGEHESDHNGSTRSGSDD